MRKDWNSYSLMHKNIPVAEIMLDSATGSICSVGAVFDSRRVPVGVPVRKGAVDRAALNAWWKGRVIPASRAGIQDALASLGVPSTDLLPEKSFGLSLSDHYWIRPADSDLAWGDALPALKYGASAI